MKFILDILDEYVLIKHVIPLKRNSIKMNHLAILKKEPIEMILSGEKIIESRWYEKKDGAL